MPNTFSGEDHLHCYEMAQLSFAGVGLLERLALPTKGIRKQADSAISESEIRNLTRKHHYNLSSRGSFVIIVVSRSDGLLTNDLDQNPLPATPIKFTIENPLPGSKIQPAFRHGNHHLPAHDLPLQMSVGVILPRAIV